jgi:hypothetical protein
VRVTRVGIALAAVIGGTLLPATSILTDVVSNPAMLQWRDDPISAFERRLAPVREALRGESVIGYLVAPEIPHRVAHLYTVRYVLAPVRVQRDRDLPLVVADGVTDVRRLPPQLRVRRDFGQGLLLLEQVPK